MRLAPYAFMLATAAFAVATFEACFSPDEPDCTFRCDKNVGNSGHCPDHYTCQADGYCHKNGTSTFCPYAADAATSVVMDQSAPADGAGPADQSMPGDMASTAADLRVECNDKARNGDETDVDCGGSCDPCGDGKTCARNADCVSMMCMGVDGGMSKCQSLADLATSD